jgi:hypothetical protein
MGSHCVVQASPKLLGSSNPLPSVSGVAGPKACAATLDCFQRCCVLPDTLGDSAAESVRNTALGITIGEGKV